MSLSFDSSSGLVVVGAEISGPHGNATLRLALDTGATRTLVNPVILATLGYDLALTKERIEITTGSGIEYAALVEIGSLSCLDQTTLRFPILAHSLPPSAGVDGLLGLDFLRSGRLQIDFTHGQVQFDQSIL